MPETSRHENRVRRELPQRTTGWSHPRTPTLQLKPDRRRAGQRDRRDVVSRAERVLRVRTEYEEMPGLRLTLAQAKRLFRLREDVCVRVLDTLVQTRVLRKDPCGCFVRVDVAARLEDVGEDSR